MCIRDRIGTNPRYEATILNARIRKSFLKNKTEIYSLGDVGDLTHPYKVLSNSTKIIKEICENNHAVSNKIINAKKPMIIIGQSALKLKSGNYIFESLKNFDISPYVLTIYTSQFSDGLCPLDLSVTISFNFLSSCFMSSDLFM